MNIILSNVDATCPIGAEILIERANKLAPVGGIFHSAHVIFLFHDTTCRYLPIRTHRVIIIYRLRVTAFSKTAPKVISIYCGK